MKNLYLFVFSFFVSISIAWSQNCPNANFSLGNFTNWVGRTGTCCPINVPTVGIVAGRHTIMTPGTDAVTGNQLQLVPPGYNFSARLGNNATGAQGEALQYTFLVSSSNALFIYNYAVVLQDPGHTPAQQPRFELRVMDAGGNNIPCTFYQVAAAGNIPGFQNFGAIRWKNWTQVGVDLSAYIGQTVTIEARTGDCSLSGHFGYGYLVGDCQPLEIQVQYCEGDTSAMLIAPNGFQSYQWSDGVNVVGNNDTLVIYNPQPGQQNYTCTIVSVTGCQATLSVAINPIVPLAGFLGDYVCNKTIDFTDTSIVYQDIINTWNWDFGDGNQSNSQNPTHIYADTGWYNVELHVQTSIGCQDTVTIQVYVEANPLADFSVPDTCSLSLLFNDLSTTFNGNQITAWDWDFDDGNHAFVQTPSHTYASVGTFDVILTITDEEGCTDSATQSVIVRAPPVADFDFLNDCVYNAIDFTDQSTVQLSTIDTWQWDFGNNQQSNTQHPSHQYAQAGDYDVQLIVGTAQGCTDTLTQAITVYAQPDVDFTYTEVCHGRTTPFTNATTAPNGTVISSYEWNFDDTNIANSALTDPVVYYQQTGTYNVMLIAQTNQGCYDTITLPVSVWPVPEVSFTADPLTGCYPHSPQFDNLSSISSGNVAYYVWNYGDNTTETIFENSHTYPNSAGLYTVSLTAVSEKGCDSTTTYNNYITVYPTPVAIFTYTPNSNITILNPFVQFTNGSIGETGYFWDFGDGGTSNNPNPFHYYPADTTTWLASLVVINQFGCTDTAFASITIGPNVTIHIPNSFTPNGDGKNDKFLISGIGLVDADLTIYNRWGDMIIELQKDAAFTVGWDGTHHGKFVKQDVYVYKVIIKDIFGDFHELYGNINVLPKE